MTHRELKQVVTDLREESGMTKARLARDAGISRPYLTQIEQGDRTPSEEVLRRLSRALGLHPLHIAAEAGYFNVTGHMEWSLRTYADAVKSGDKHRVAEAAKMLEGDLQWEGLDNEGHPTEDSLWDGMEHLISPPEGWSRLKSDDRKLVERLVKRLLEGADYL